MRSVAFFFSALLIFFLSGCDPDNNEEGLRLNDGKKWEVNDEMKPHIEKGRELLSEFIASADTNFIKLAEDLDGQNRALIMSCTMKGEAHDELHKWLYPHMELIEDLSAAENFDEAEVLVKDLDRSFRAYGDYFQ